MDCQHLQRGGATVNPLTIANNVRLTGDHRLESSEWPSSAAAGLFQGQAYRRMDGPNIFKKMLGKFSLDYDSLGSKSRLVI